MRVAGESGLDIEVAAINDTGPISKVAHLLRHDSIHGRLAEDVMSDGDGIIVGGRHVTVYSERDPRAIGWDQTGVDVVIEATGAFTSRDSASGHLSGSVRKVIITAPADCDVTIVVGVNDGAYDPARHHVVSNASCTTNCLAPMIKVLDETFGLEGGLMTTTHAYTGDQSIVDGSHNDLRRARAAAINVVPTTTGAARATGDVLPSMSGRLDGIAMRVPVANGSITDFVGLLTRAATVAEVNEAFWSAAEFGSLARVLEYSDEPLVTTDILGNPASCVFDSSLTMVHGRLVKVLGWYDNEWGYSSRLVDLAALVGGLTTPLSSVSRTQELR
jgi:glyceraldehyde 3-phosphate dehydrogenase